MTAEWLHLKLRNSHGFVSTECNVDSIKTYSIGTDGMNGYLESLSTAGPPLVMILRTVTLEGLTIDLTPNTSSLNG